MGEIEIVVAIISLGSAMLGLIGALISRRQVLVVRNQVDPLPAGPATGGPMASHGSAPAVWYDNIGWLMFWLFFFWPVGVYGFYMTRALSASVKKIIAWALGALVVLAAMSG
jgi:hypothetical protein